MAMSWQDINTRPAAGGIDSYSSKAKTEEGFVEDAVNMDVDASGKWSTRPGYETYYGWMPLRVRRFVQSGTAIKLYFDSSTTIDLAQTGVGPVIVSGRLPYASDYGTSSFSNTDNTVYFPYYGLSSRDTITGTGTISRSADDTGLTSKYVFVQVCKSDSTTNVSNTTLDMQSVVVDNATFDMSVSYSIIGSEEVFFIYKPKEAEAGSVYIAPIASTTQDVTFNNYDGLGDVGVNAVSFAFVDGDAVRFTTTGSLPANLSADTTYYIIDSSTGRSKLAASPGGTPIAYVSAGTGTHTATLQGQTFTIDAATHNLNNFQIGVKVYDESTGDSVEVVAEQITLNPSTGEVTVTIGDSIDGYAILTTVPAENAVSEAALAGTNTFTIVGPPSPYCFYYVYAYDSISGVYIEVVPESISYDAASDTTSIEYVLAASSESVEVYWETASTVSNILTLTDTGSATLDLTDPSLTIWGVGHQNIYRSGTQRGGWVHGLDNYKSTGQEHLVACVGGAPYYALAEVDASASALIPANYANLRKRTGSERILSPLFATADTGRTRGSVVDASVENYMALCTAITFVSTGVVDVTLSFTNKTGNVDIGGTISTSDKLTISGMGDNRNNGTFLISSVVSDTATETVVRIANADAVDDQVNEAGMLGRAGVFTDVVGFASAHSFVGGDTITYTGTSVSWPVVGLMSTTTVLVEVEEPATLPANILMYGTRRSRVIQIRDNSGTVTVENYVPGDSISCPFVDNKPVILNVNSQPDATATVVVSGGVATATFGATQYLNTNAYVFFYGDVTNSINGEQLLTFITDSTTAVFSTSAADGTYTGYLLGDCVELDESIEWWDSSSASSTGVIGRWWPIDAPPVDSLNPYIVDTAYKYFDANAYSEQPITSSVVMADTMYFANGDDSILKYDGTYVYNAGLNRVIPSVFMTLDTSVASIQPGFQVAYTAVSVSGKYFRIEVDAFKTGDRVYDSTTGLVFTVVEKQLVPGGTDKYNIVVAEDTSALSGTGTLTKVKRFRFYTRFNMIDRNNNIIASNAANSSDCYFDVYEAGRILIKTSGYPILAYGDYDRIEMEVYKTESDTEAPFYLTKRINIESGTSSVVIYDDVDDAQLTQLDAVNSALLGQEIGTGWQPPYRAGMITTADNSLIIGNLKSWPRLDITMKAQQAALTAANLAGFSYLFRKSNDDTTTVSDFENVQKWVFVNSSAVSLNANTTFTFTAGDVTPASGNINKNSHGLLTGAVIRLAGSDIPGGLSTSSYYYVIKVDANNFKLASTLDDAIANTNLTFSDAGSGTNTLTSSGWTDGNQIYSPAHGLTTGDWIYMFYSAAGNYDSLAHCGWFQVNVTSAYTFTLLGSGYESPTFGGDVPDSYVTAPTKTDIPVWLGTDGNYGNVDGNPSGSIELAAARRLADSINFTMTTTQYNSKAIAPDFHPWLTAYAGADYNVGQIVVENQVVQLSTMEAVIGTIPDHLAVFVNGIARGDAEQVSASTYLYPSRVGISFKNYPEIFDNLDGTQTESQSVVDINPADGQSVVAGIQFFGESTFGAANLNQVVVLFKPNSIYVLDVRTRQYQKIDSRGIGCTAPKTVASTKDGIMFVYKGGIYRLSAQGMRVDFVGRYMRGRWKELVGTDSLDVAAATHWGDKRQYKVFLPPTDAPGVSGEDVYPTQTFVYNYDNEEQGRMGSWTRYTNIDALLGCNQAENNFFASPNGVVFQVRNYSAAIDYRDDVSSIPTSITFRADDFGVPSSRKSVLRTVLQLDTVSTALSNVTVYTATNLSSNFNTTASMNLTTADGTPVIECSPADKKGTHIQVKVAHTAYDEALSIVGLGYEVNKLTFQGVSQSADFS